MDDVQQLTATIADALRTVGTELTSLRLLLQFGLILLAAIVGTLAASLIRRRLDLAALTAGLAAFPARIRTAAAGQSRHHHFRAGGRGHARGACCR